MAKNKINIISEENIFTIEWIKVKRFKIDKRYRYIHLYKVHTHTSTSTYNCIHKIYMHICRQDIHIHK